MKNLKDLRHLSLSMAREEEEKDSWANFAQKIAEKSAKEEAERLEKDRLASLSWVDRLLEEKEEKCK